MKNENFLIIGGMPKAGTTSVYNWLSDHPDICPSKVKETRFFIDEYYPHPYSGAKRYNGNNLKEYFDYFSKTSAGKVLLESSTDYLYCETPKLLFELLPNAKFLFIIRDPVERALSWYKFSAQLGLLDDDVTFEDYIKPQLGVPVYHDTPVHLRAIDQNRVNKYLDGFIKLFGEERCLVLDFKDFKTNPRAAISKVCKFCDIDNSFYIDYTFDPKNVSLGVHTSGSVTLYYKLRALFVYVVKPSPRIKMLFRPAAMLLKKSMSLKTKKINKIVISKELEEEIRRDAMLDN